MLIYLRTPPTHYHLESYRRANYMETHPQEVDLLSTKLVCRSRHKKRTKDEWPRSQVACKPRWEQGHQGESAYCTPPSRLEKPRVTGTVKLDLVHPFERRSRNLSLDTLFHTLANYLMKTPKTWSCLALRN